VLSTGGKGVAAGDTTFSHDCRRPNLHGFRDRYEKPSCGLESGRSRHGPAEAAPNVGLDKLRKLLNFLFELILNKVRIVRYLN
jgi:hypothetical protein